MSPSEKDNHEDVEQWQIEEIKKGLEEADRGEFATDEEVQQTLKRLMRGVPRAIADSGRAGRGKGLASELPTIRALVLASVLAVRI